MSILKDIYPTITLIEPDDELRALNDRVLRMAGYIVSQRSDSCDLVTLAELIRPDVIVIGLGTLACVDLQVLDDLHTNSNTAAIPIVAYSLLRESEVTMLTRTRERVTLIAPYSITALWNGIACALGEPPPSTPSSQSPGWFVISGQPRLMRYKLNQLSLAVLYRLG